MLTALMNKRQYSAAYLTLANACETADEMVAMLRESQKLALQAALDQYARNKAAKELLLKLAIAVALAAVGL